MKPITRSKTFWLNVLLLLIASVGVLAESPLLAEYSELLLLTGALANIALRTLTDQGVFVVPPKAAPLQADQRDTHPPGDEEDR